MSDPVALLRIEKAADNEYRRAKREAYNIYCQAVKEALEKRDAVKTAARKKYK